MNLNVNDNNVVSLVIADSAGLALSGTDAYETEANIDDNNLASVAVIDDNGASLTVGDMTTIVSNPYTGAYEVTPKAYEEQTLYTANKTMTDNVTVHEVPYYETPNTDGNTVYIASEV